MNVQQWNVAEAFNLAMADWGVSKNPSSELFERVVRLDADDRFKIDSPNYHQCISLALFLAGEQEKAKSRLATARLALERKVLSSFSCWRYLALPPNELLEDLRSMQMYFDGIGEGPPVIYLQESQEN